MMRGIASYKKKNSVKPKQKEKKKRITWFRPMIRSRHPSHSVLRRKLELLPFRSVIRLGSTTELKSDSRKRIECNSVEAIRNSASKLLMKQCFTRAEVQTAKWWTYSNGFFHTRGSIQSGDNASIDILEYPIVAKSHYGSRGEGNTKLDTQQELEAWMRDRTLSNHIFEKFYNYTREYRLHVSNNGCFYTCRKMLRDNTPEEDKWHRHESNCVWILESNSLFDKPSNWNTIVSESIKAMNSVGLDFAAIDVKVQSAKDSKGKVRENPDFIIIETNSAPSFGEGTALKYLTEIPKILKSKYNKEKISNNI